MQIVSIVSLNAPSDLDGFASFEFGIANLQFSHEVTKHKLSTFRTKVMRGH